MKPSRLPQQFREQTLLPKLTDKEKENLDKFFFKKIPLEYEYIKTRPVTDDHLQWLWKKYKTS